MPLAYWITSYHKISDMEKVNAYAKLASPAIKRYGGQYLARGIPQAVFESGLAERTVVTAFPSVEIAIEAHDSPEYSRALEALGNGAVREIRIVEGLV